MKNYYHFVSRLVIIFLIIIPLQGISSTNTFTGTYSPSPVIHINGGSSGGVDVTIYAESTATYENRPTDIVLGTFTGKINVYYKSYGNSGTSHWYVFGTEITSANQTFDPFTGTIQIGYYYGVHVAITVTEKGLTLATPQISAASSCIAVGATTSISTTTSQTGAYYQLYKYGNTVGSSVSGTGSSLTWSSLSADNSYPYLVKATGGTSQTQTSNNCLISNPGTTASVSTTTLNYCKLLTSESLGGNTASVGTGKWTLISGPGTATFSSASSSTSTVTVSAYGTYVFAWTITYGSCSTTATVTVNFYATPTTASVSSSTLNYCGSLASAILGGNTASVGTGSWSKTSGPGTVTFSSVNSGTSTATVSAYGTYVFKWTITNGTCSTSASVTVNYYAPITLTISPTSSSICYNTSPGTLSVTASGGTGTYSYQWYNTSSGIISGATSSSYSPGSLTASTGYYCIVTGGGVCEATRQITVTVNALPTITGTLTCCPNATRTLTGSGTAATTNPWISATTSVATISSSGVVTGVSNGSSVITYTDNNGCSKTATMTINSYPTISSVTGSTQCGSGTATLSATASISGSIINWYNLDGTLVNTGTSYSPTISATTTYYLDATYYCTTTSRTPNTATVFNLPTTANAGTDQNNCNSGTFTLAGNSPSYGTGNWSLVSGTATITTPTSRVSTVTGVPVGTSAILRWTISNGTCTPSTDDVVLTNYPTLTTALAGSDQNNCNNSSFTMAANSVATLESGTWTLVSGIATITSATSPTTTVTGVTAGTSATLRWTITNKGCGTSSTDDVVITNYTSLTTAQAGNDQYNCNNSSFTMAANSVASLESGTWTLVSGTATITSPNSPTTTVTGVPAGTSATLRWTITNKGCGTTSTDDVVLTNYPALTTSQAGSDQNNCNNSSFTMAANSVASLESGKWSLISGTATITTSTSPISTVTGVPVGTSATLRWTITNKACGTSTDDVVLTNYPTLTTALAGSDQNNCNNSSFTLAGDSCAKLESGKWSLISGTATITSPTSPISTVTGLTAGTSATLRWTITNKGCGTSSTDDVVLTNYPSLTTALAGNDQNNCNNSSFTMAANSVATLESGTWTLVSGTATITSANSPTTTVTGVTSGTSATLRWTITNKGCGTSSTDDVVLTNYPSLTTALAGSDQNNCNNSSFTMAANSVATLESGTWTLVSGTATITSPTLPTTTVTGVTSGTSANLRWTITNKGCGTTSTDDVVVTNYTTLTTAQAGSDQYNCNNSNFTMAANSVASLESGKWSIILGSGTITTPTSPTTTVTGVPVGTSATLRWTITNNACGTSTDDVVLINYPSLTSAQAGSDQNNCNSSSFTLAANSVATLESGKWSLISGTATITTPTSPTSTVTGVPAGKSATLRWTITNNACGTSTDNVVLTNYPALTAAQAGNDQVNCNNGSFTLAANSCASLESGAWSIVSGTATITTTSVSTSTTTSTTTYSVTGVPVGTSAILRWTITNKACGTSTDDIVVTNYPSLTTAQAGNDQFNCNNSSFTMAANSVATLESGTWTLLSGTATISSANSATSTVTGVPAGTSATLRWTITNAACGTSTDDVVVTNYPALTTALAGSDQNNCNSSSFTMAANSCATLESGIWSLISGSATITTPSSPTSTVTGVAAGTSATLRWTITNKACGTSTDDIVLTNYSIVTIAQAGSDLNNCNSGNFTLAGNSCTTLENGKWSIISGTATITEPTSPTSTVTGVPIETEATLRWTISNGTCTSSTDDIILKNYNTPSTATISSTPLNYCGILTSGSLGGNNPVTGKGTWSILSGGTGAFSNSGDYNTTFTADNYGTYTLQWTIRNGTCTSSSANVVVNFYQTPTITTATTAVDVCYSDVLQTSNLTYNEITGNPTTYSIIWNSTPSNSFEKITNAALTSSPIVISVPAGTSAGTYTGTITVTNEGGCISASSNFTLTVKSLPPIISITNNSRCGNGIVTLSATTPAGTINWYDASTNGTLLASGTSYSPTVTETKSFYVDATYNSCTTASRREVQATVNSVPASGSLTLTPYTANICEGTTVSAKATSGTGGAGTVTDFLQYQFDKSGSWSNYESETVLSTTDHSEIKIQTYRTSSISSCPSSYPTTYSWTIYQQPTGPTLNTKNPNSTVVCAEQGVSATFNEGSGGYGCSDDFIVIIDDGSPVTYKSGEIVGAEATQSIVIRGRRAGCNESSGCTGTSYTTLASWTVNSLPTATISGTTIACGHTTLSAHTNAPLPTYVWYKDNEEISGESSSTLYITESGSYKVKIKHGYSECENTSAIIIVIINAIPTVETAIVNPATVCESGEVEFSATASSGTIKWYEATTGGDEVSPPTYISNTTTLYAQANSEGCKSALRKEVIATVKERPTVAASVVPSSVCNSGNVTFSAVASEGSIKWYNAATDGDEVDPPTFIDETTKLYAQAITYPNCLSDRKQVVAVVNASPTITNVSNNSRCGNGEVTLSAKASEKAAIINWYNSATDGTSLGKGEDFTPTINETTTYYIDATYYCTTPTRTPVIATYNPNTITVETGASGSYSSEGETRTYTIATCSNTFTVSGQTEWINTEINENGLLVTCLENTSALTREAVITITSPDAQTADAAIYYLKITQSGASLILYTDPEYAEFDRAGGEASIVIHANIDWKITQIPDFINLTTDGNTLHISCDINKSTEKLSGDIIVSTELKDISINVTQNLCGSAGFNNSIQPQKLCIDKYDDPGIITIQNYDPVIQYTLMKEGKAEIPGSPDVDGPYQEDNNLFWRVYTDGIYYCTMINPNCKKEVITSSAKSDVGINYIELATGYSNDPLISCEGVEEQNAIKVEFNTCSGYIELVETSDSWIHARVSGNELYYWVDANSHFNSKVGTITVKTGKSYHSGEIAQLPSEIEFQYSIHQSGGCDGIVTSFPIFIDQQCVEEQSSGTRIYMNNRQSADEGYTYTLHSDKNNFSKLYIGSDIPEWTGINLVGEYYVTCDHNNEGWNSRMSNNVYLYNYPSVNIYPQLSTVCAGEEFTLAPNGDAETWVWKVDQQIYNTPTFSFNESGTTKTISLTGYITIDGNNYCPNTDQIEVYVKPLPIVSITSSANDLCLTEGTRTLSGTPSGGYFSTESEGASISNNILTVTSTGIKDIKYTITENNCTNSASQNITVIDEDVQITSSSSVLALDETRLLTATPTGGTFTIASPNSVGASISNNSSPYLSASSLGQVTIYYTYPISTNCNKTVSQTITIVPETFKIISSDINFTADCQEYQQVLLRVYNLGNIDTYIHISRVDDDGGDNYIASQEQIQPIDYNENSYPFKLYTFKFTASPRTSESESTKFTTRAGTIYIAYNSKNVGSVNFTQSGYELQLLSSSSLNFSSPGQIETVSFNAKANWQIKEEIIPSWLHVSTTATGTPTALGAPAQLKVYCDPNPYNYSRPQAIITIENNGTDACAAISVIVSQEPCTTPEKMAIQYDNSCIAGETKDLYIERSEIGVEYQLYLNSTTPVSTPQSTIDGSRIDWYVSVEGVYSIKAITACTSTTFDDVQLYKPIAPYQIENENHCIPYNTSVKSIYIDQTQDGTIYQLYKNGNLYESSKIGNGSTLTWNEGVGSYFVIASNSCNASVQSTNNITLSLLPDVFLPANVNRTISSCDSYTLPEINGYQLSSSNHYYYDASGGPEGGGNRYEEGTPITDLGSKTLYIYDDNNGCTDEDYFTLTINKTVPDFNISAENECLTNKSSGIIQLNDSWETVNYTLKINDVSIPISFKGNGSTLKWDQLSDGEYKVSASNTCSTKLSNSITLTMKPDIDPKDSVGACGSYVLSAITGKYLTGNESYFTTPTHIGTSFKEGDRISVNTIMYIYDNNNGCYDNEIFSINIEHNECSFTYPQSVYCIGDPNPSAIVGVNSVAGIFTTSDPGLIILNSTTGSIDLTNSTPRFEKYVITNTVAQTSTCPGGSCTYDIYINGDIINVGQETGAICQGNTTTALEGSFSGTASGAIWSDGGSGGTFLNNDGTRPDLTTYTAANDAPSTIILTLTSTNEKGCQTVTASKTLTIIQKPIVEAGEDQLAAINKPILLQGASYQNGSSLLWTHNGSGILTNTTSLTPSYTPSSEDAGKTITFKLTVTGITACNLATIDDTKEVTITEAKAGESQEVCVNKTATISGAKAVNGTFVWTHDGKGSLTETLTLTPTYHPSSEDAGETVTVTLTTTGTDNYGQIVVSDNCTILVDPLPKAEAGTLPTIRCSNENATVEGASSENGTFTWSHDGNGTLSNDNTQAPTYTPTALDEGKTVTLTLTVKGINGCTDNVVADQCSLYIDYNSTPTLSVDINNPCPDESIILTINGGQLGYNANWNWYKRDPETNIVTDLDMTETNLLDTPDKTTIYMVTSNLCSPTVTVEKLVYIIPVEGGTIEKDAKYYEVVHNIPIDNVAKATYGNCGITYSWEKAIYERKYKNTSREEWHNLLTWKTISGATSLNYKTKYLFESTCFRRVATDGKGHKAYSNIVLIEVYPDLIPPVSLIPDEIIKSSTSVVNLRIHKGQLNWNGKWEWYNNNDKMTKPDDQERTDSVFHNVVVSKSTRFRARGEWEELDDNDTKLRDRRTYFVSTKVQINKKIDLSLFSNYNYVVSYSPDVEKKSITAIEGLPLEDQGITISYFDGLGRPIQQIGVNQSYFFNDVVTGVEYDAFGRKIKDYLPTPIEKTYPGGFESQLSVASDYYYSKNPMGNEMDGFTGGGTGYLQTCYEASPLNRIIATYDATGNETNYEYGTNTASKTIPIWKVVSNVATKTGAYDAGQLYVTTITPPSGPVEIEYKDKEGNVIMKSTGGLETYYVYDDFGLLRFVFPPLMSEFINGVTTIDPVTASENTFNQLGYYYEYDARKRMIKKKLPGVDEVYMVYDDRDRLSLVQDGKTRDEDPTRWLCNRYDGLNRVIQTGWVITTNTFEDMTSGVASVPSSPSQQLTSTEYNTTTGLVEKVTAAYLDGSPNSTETTFSYDEFNRVTMKKITGSPIPLTTTYSYNFKNQVLTTNESYNGATTDGSSNSEADIIHKTYTYDHAGRLENIKMQLTSGGNADTHNNEVMISQMDYNELGQPILKKLHMANDTSWVQDIDYVYDARGWLQQMNNVDNDTALVRKLFSQNFTYDAAGNITNSNWRSTLIDEEAYKPKPSNKKTYGYVYDNMNRLTDAFYSETDYITNLETMKGAFDETGIGYDNNGNITNLLRRGAVKSGTDENPTISYQAIDNLSYSYQGNQLQQLDDKITTDPGHSFQVNTGTSGFTYDKNGNVLTAGHKGIQNIQYNYLNLPNYILGQGSISYIYDASGRKLEKSSGTTTTYMDNMMMENNKPIFFTGEGRVYETTRDGKTFMNYEYWLKDHLGNTRVRFTADSSEVMPKEYTDYYAFGLLHYNLDVATQDINNYLYNGKELQTDFELNWYDYGARFYDPALGRFHSVDPMAETYSFQSPYCYAVNNPISLIDFMGMEPKVGADGLTDEQWLNSHGDPEQEGKYRSQNREEQNKKQNNSFNPHIPNLFPKSQEKEAYKYLWGLSWLIKETKWDVEALAFLTDKGVLVLPAIDFVAVRDFGYQNNGIEVNLEKGFIYSNLKYNCAPSLSSVLLSEENKTISFNNSLLNIQASIHTHDPTDGIYGGISGTDQGFLSKYGPIFMMGDVGMVVAKGAFSISEKRFTQWGGFSTVNKLLYDKRISLYNNLDPLN